MEGATTPVQEEQSLQPSDPVNCVYVRFDGLKRVSPHSLIVECGALQHPRTLGELQWALEHTHARLSELNLFKSVRANVSTAPNGVVNIAFLVEERNREVTAGGDVDKKGELSCNLHIEQPAVLGGPLSVSGTVGSTVHQAHEFNLRAFTPRFLGHRCNWSFDIAKASNDEAQASSYVDHITNAVVRLADPAGIHAICLEAALHDLRFPITGHRWPSVEVQQARLRSVKTSLKYSFANTWLFAGGFRLWTLPSAITVRSELEAAGLSGDARFLRGEAHMSFTSQLPWHCLLSCTGACGVLLPTDGRPSCLQERFFLGGSSGSTTVLKGFAHRGIGPVGLCQARTAKGNSKRMSDALGGDAMMNWFAAISAPLLLPNLPPGAGMGARVFAFAGLGTLAPQVRLGGDGVIHSLRQGTRASVGLGVGLPISGLGTLEFTLAYPMWTQHHDIKQSRQVGLRLELKS